jgi:NADH dehydrogenase FAD-containing subunit
MARIDRRHAAGQQEQKRRLRPLQDEGRILPEMSEMLAIFAQRILRKRGVEIILNDRLKAATDRRSERSRSDAVRCAGEGNSS